MLPLRKPASDGMPIIPNGLMAKTSWKNGHLALLVTQARLENCKHRQKWLSTLATHDKTLRGLRIERLLTH
jgi:hypothetical protein